MTDFNKLAETMAAMGIQIKQRDPEQHMQESIEKRMNHYVNKQKQKPSYKQLTPEEAKLAEEQAINDFYQHARIKD
jgi:hypothetical protein